jgi:hypothetical protein
LNGRNIVTSFAKIAAASAVLSFVCYVSYHTLITQLGSSTFTLKLVEVLVPIALGAIAFAIATKLLRVTELEKVFGMLRRKFGR